MRSELVRNVSGKFIPLWEPELSGAEWKYVKECLDTKWLSSAGSFVDRFERDVAQYVGSSHAVALMNGTVALHVALRVIGVEEDDEVFVPNLTFVAPVNAVTYCRAYPVLMDADPETWQMDVRKLERFLEERCEVRSGETFNTQTGRRIRAIIPVHILGSACRMDVIMRIAGRYGLRVVEDAAEGIGVRYQGRHVGTFGDIGIFSFNGNKLITAGGGGMLVSNDAKSADYARYLSTQAKDDTVEYIHDEVGYNYRMTNLNAALGVGQLEQIDAFLERKRQMAKTYREALSDCSEIVPMPMTSETAGSYWLYTVLLPAAADVETRRRVIADLRDRGVGARALWHPMNGLKPYQTSTAFEIEHSPAIYRRAVSLPSSVRLTAEDIRWCVDRLRESVNA